MRSLNKTLFPIIAVLVALTSACASGQLPEQRVDAKASEARTQQDSTAVAAIVKATKANLRARPSQSAAVLSTVSKGELLSLTGSVPIGPWYQIRDSKTGVKGWIHGNTIALLQTTETSTASATSARIPRTSSPSAQRARTVSPPVSDISLPRSSRPTSGKSYVNVDGVRVPSPVFSNTRPAGASARCRDGS